MLLRTALHMLALDGFTAIATRDRNGEESSAPIESVLSQADAIGDVLDMEVHFDESIGIGCDGRRFLVDSSGRPAFVATRDVVAIPAAPQAAAELLVDDGDGAPRRALLAEFLEANAEDADTCEQVRALKVGDRVTLGVGAAPVFKVERVR